MLVVVAYAAAQFGLLNQLSGTYLALNLIGSVILAVLAWREEQFGFLMLEVVWTLVTLWSLARWVRGTNRRLR